MLNVLSVIRNTAGLPQKSVRRTRQNNTQNEGYIRYVKITVEPRCAEL